MKKKFVFIVFELVVEEDQSYVNNAAVI